MNFTKGNWGLEKSNVLAQGKSGTTGRGSSPHLGAWDFTLLESLGLIRCHSMPPYPPLPHFVSLSVPFPPLLSLRLCPGSILMWKVLQFISIELIPLTCQVLFRTPPSSSPRSLCRYFQLEVTSLLPKYPFMFVFFKPLPLLSLECKFFDSRFYIWFAFVCQDLLFSR